MLHNWTEWDSLDQFTLCGGVTSGWQVVVCRLQCGCIPCTALLYSLHRTECAGCAGCGAVQRCRSLRCNSLHALQRSPARQ